MPFRKFSVSLPHVFWLGLAAERARLGAGAGGTAQA